MDEQASGARSRAAAGKAGREELQVLPHCVRGGQRLQDRTGGHGRLGEHTQIDKGNTTLPPLPFTAQLRAIKASSAEVLCVWLLIIQPCPCSCDPHSSHYQTCSQRGKFGQDGAPSHGKKIQTRVFGMTLAASLGPSSLQPLSPPRHPLVIPAWLTQGRILSQRSRS